MRSFFDGVRSFANQQGLRRDSAAEPAAPDAPFAPEGAVHFECATHRGAAVQVSQPNTPRSDAELASLWQRAALARAEHSVSSPAAWGALGAFCERLLVLQLRRGAQPAHPLQPAAALSFVAEALHAAADDAERSEGDGVGGGEAAAAAVRASPALRLVARLGVAPEGRIALAPHDVVAPVVVLLRALASGSAAGDASPGSVDALRALASLLGSPVPSDDDEEDDDAAAAAAAAALSRSSSRGGALLSRLAASAFPSPPPAPPAISGLSAAEAEAVAAASALSLHCVKPLLLSLPPPPSTLRKTHPGARTAERCVLASLRALIRLRPAAACAALRESRGLEVLLLGIDDPLPASTSNEPPSAQIHHAFVREAIGSRLARLACACDTVGCDREAMRAANVLRLFDRAAALLCLAGDAAEAEAAAANGGAGGTGHDPLHPLSAAFELFAALTAGLAQEAGTHRALAERSLLAVASAAVGGGAVVPSSGHPSGHHPPPPGCPRPRLTAAAVSFLAAAVASAPLALAALRSAGFETALFGPRVWGATGNDNATKSGAGEATESGVKLVRGAVESLLMAAASAPAWRVGGVKVELGVEPEVGALVAALSAASTSGATQPGVHCCAADAASLAALLRRLLSASPARVASAAAASSAPAALLQCAAASPALPCGGAGACRAAFSALISHEACAHKALADAPGVAVLLDLAAGDDSGAGGAEEGAARGWARECLATLAAVPAQGSHQPPHHNGSAAALPPGGANHPKDAFHASLACALLSDSAAPPDAAAPAPASRRPLLLRLLRACAAAPGGRASLRRAPAAFAAAASLRPLSVGASVSDGDAADTTRTLAALFSGCGAARAGFGAAGGWGRLEGAFAAVRRPSGGLLRLALALCCDGGDDGAEHERGGDGLTESGEERDDTCADASPPPPPPLPLRHAPAVAPLLSLLRNAARGTACTHLLRLADAVSRDEASQCAACDASLPSLLIDWLGRAAAAPSPGSEQGDGDDAGEEEGLQRALLSCLSSCAAIATRDVRAAVRAAARPEAGGRDGGAALDAPAHDIGCGGGIEAAPPSLCEGLLNALAAAAAGAPPPGAPRSFFVLTPGGGGGGGCDGDGDAGLRLRPSLRWPHGRSLSFTAWVRLAPEEKDSSGGDDGGGCLVALRGACGGGMHLTLRASSATLTLFAPQPPQPRTAPPPSPPSSPHPPPPPRFAPPTVDCVVPFPFPSPLAPGWHALALVLTAAPMSLLSGGDKASVFIDGAPLPCGAKRIRLPRALAFLPLPFSAVAAAPPNPAWAPLPPDRVASSSRLDEWGAPPLDSPPPQGQVLIPAPPSSPRPLCGAVADPVVWDGALRGAAVARLWSARPGCDLAAAVAPSPDDGRPRAVLALSASAVAASQAEVDAEEGEAAAAAAAAGGEARIALNVAEGRDPWEPPAGSGAALCGGAAHAVLRCVSSAFASAGGLRSLLPLLAPPFSGASAAAALRLAVAASPPSEWADGGGDGGGAGLVEAALRRRRPGSTPAALLRAAAGALPPAGLGRVARDARLWAVTGDASARADCALAIARHHAAPLPAPDAATASFARRASLLGDVLEWMRCETDARAFDALRSAVAALLASPDAAPHAAADAGALVHALLSWPEEGAEERGRTHSLAALDASPPPSPPRAASTAGAAPAAASLLLSCLDPACASFSQPLSAALSALDVGAVALRLALACRSGEGGTRFRDAARLMRRAAMPGGCSPEAVAALSHHAASAHPIPPPPDSTSPPPFLVDAAWVEAVYALAMGVDDDTRGAPPDAAAAATPSLHPASSFGVSPAPGGGGSSAARSASLIAPLIACPAAMGLLLRRLPLAPPAVRASLLSRVARLAERSVRNASAIASLPSWPAAVLLPMGAAACGGGGDGGDDILGTLARAEAEAASRLARALHGHSMHRSTSSPGCSGAALARTSAFASCPPGWCALPPGAGAREARLRGFARAAAEALSDVAASLSWSPHTPSAVCDALAAADEALPPPASMLPCRATAEGGDASDPPLLPHLLWPLALAAATTLARLLPVLDGALASLRASEAERAASGSSLRSRAASLIASVLAGETPAQQLESARAAVDDAQRRGLRLLLLASRCGRDGASRDAAALKAASKVVASLSPSLPSLLSDPQRAQLFLSALLSSTAHTAGLPPPPLFAQRLLFRAAVAAGFLPPPTTSPEEEGGGEGGWQGAEKTPSSEAPRFPAQNEGEGEGDARGFDGDDAALAAALPAVAAVLSERLSQAVVVAASEAEAASLRADAARADARRAALADQLAAFGAEEERAALRGRARAFAAAAKAEEEHAARRAAADDAAAEAADAAERRLVACLRGADAGEGEDSDAFWKVDKQEDALRRRRRLRRDYRRGRYTDDEDAQPCVAQRTARFKTQRRSRPSRPLTASRAAQPPPTTPLPRPPWQRRRWRRGRRRWRRLRARSQRASATLRSARRPLPSTTTTTPWWVRRSRRTRRRRRR